MQAQVGNRRYDSNAEFICDWENGRPIGNPWYVWEGLFRDNSGGFFLHGRGGCASKYAKHLGHDIWLAGAEIRPVTEDQALMWLDWTGHQDVIEQLFGYVAV